MKRGFRQNVDGRGSVLDNLFQEYLWRDVNCENICRNRRETVCCPQTGWTASFDF